MQQPALSSTRLAAFVSPEAPFAAFLIVLVVYVPPFYAGELGLGLSAVGLIFGLTKLWDLVTDPAFGVLSDRWHTRWGRRLPWLILSVPILVLSTYRVLMPEADVTGGDFAFWMVVIYIGWTFGTVSHIAWAAELSEDYHERSRISAYKQGAALIGSLGLLVAVAVAERFFGIDEVQRMQLIAYLLIVLLPVTVAAALWATPEPSSRAVPKRGTTPGILRRLLENPPLRRLLGANLLLGIAAGAQGGLFLFYAEDVLRLGNWSSFAIIPFMFSGLLFLPLFLFLSRRIEKHQTLCCALLYQIVAGLLFLVIPENSVVIASLALLLLGASGSVSTFIPRAMMADIGDMNTAQTGAAQTGLYMSLLQSTSKIAAAIAVGLSYPILSLIGFDPAPGALNTEAALQGLRVMMFALPAIAFGLVIALMWRFPLTKAAHAALQSTIN
ncbi:MAG: MFS transporter, partial [Pseudomonadota bacterium]